MRFDDDFDDWYDFRDRFPVSEPRTVEGGIRAASKRGNFGESWWARRWIAVLESFNIGGRLGRGRNYARRGQVISIDVCKGAVSAAVQGSRPAPYQVSIKIPPLKPAEWERVAAELSREAVFAAKLLAGEMPQDIERAFTATGLSLFPKTRYELHTSCSCPDSSNPCKHIAAVYYLLGEAFDRDPFLIFRLRGMDRDEFTAMLFASGAAPAAEPLPEPEPLPADPQAFWAARPLPHGLIAGLDLPKVPAALLRRLGNMPFWRGESPIVEMLEPVYVRAARAGEALVIGEQSK